MTDTGPVPASTIRLALETLQKAIDKGMVEAKPIVEALKKKLTEKGKTYGPD